MSLLPAARDDAPTRDVLIGQVGRGPQAHLMALGAAWKYVYVAGENRELLFRYRGEAPELRDHLGGGEAGASEAAAALRRALQERYRADGAGDVLDGTSPNGFRLLPARPARYRPPAPSGFRQQNEQYARWIQALPDGWTPPPPSPAGAIPPDLPLRSDQARYTWPPLPPVQPPLPLGPERGRSGAGAGV
jgi:hypothetical protein